MNSKHLDIFKTVLFIAGLVLVGIAFAIINYPLLEEGLTSIQFDVLNGKIQIKEIDGKVSFDELKKEF